MLGCQRCPHYTGERQPSSGVYAGNVSAYTDVIGGLGADAALSLVDKDGFTPPSYEFYAGFQKADRQDIYNNNPPLEERWSIIAKPA